MGPRLSPANLKLYRVTDEVLHYLWDPIGVAGDPEARDEYNGYLGMVFRLVKEGSSESVIAQNLDEARTEKMGLQSDIRKCLRIASILIRWRQFIEKPNVSWNA